MISVIVPVHNRAAETVEAIASVRNQTVASWELVIVDDGSTDGTFEIVQQAASDDDRIVALRHPDGLNLGPGASRNLGLSVAKGEIVAFLDSDDLWSPSTLETYLDAFNRFPTVALVYAKARVVGSLGSDDEFGYGVPWVPADLFSTLAFKNVIPTSATAVRRSAMGEDPFPVDMPSCQDWACWLRLSIDRRFLFVDQELLHLRTSDDSITGRGLASTSDFCRYTLIQTDFMHRMKQSIPPSRRSQLGDGLAWRSAECLLRAAFSIRHACWSDGALWLSAWVKAGRVPSTLASSVRLSVRTMMGKSPAVEALGVPQI